MRTTIVVPCFNEANRLEGDRFLAFTRQHESVSFQFVNDGSGDRTGELLDSLCLRNARQLRVLHLSRNSGKAEAVRQGMLAALDGDAEAAGYWDADLATPLEAIPTYQDVLTRLPEIALILGVRLPLLGHRIQRAWLRSRLGRLFSGCASWVAGFPVRDTQCGAKLFRNQPETRRLFEEPFISRWIFDVELLVRWREVCRVVSKTDAAAHVYELPLEHWREIPGSKLRGRDFLRAVRELVAIWWKGWPIHPSDVSRSERVTPPQKLRA